MDRMNTIDSFEEVGMCNPFRTKKSLEKAKNSINELEFDTEVYPKAIFEAITTAIVMKEEKINPPKCIFVPDTKMIRIMIKALLTYGKNDQEDVFLLRFGILTPKNDELESM